jgi:Uma2 family endonuclease
VPESISHQEAGERLKLVLDAWTARSHRNAFVARNLAVRWIEEFPGIGVDPDVCLLEPSPDIPEAITSICTWKSGQGPPSLCIEVVSANHPHKDYQDLQDRYAAMGTRELVVFDPLLAGPKALGGPASLQLWRSDALGILERVYFGDGPVHSLVLDAWLHPSGFHLDVADDREGLSRWLTGEAQERAEKEKERAEKEKERAARIDLERRVADLEARGSGGSGSH